MNKTKLQFITLLAKVGLEDKAEKSLVAEMKKLIPTLPEMEANTAKLRASKKQYQELSNQMTEEKKQLEKDIVGLRQSINRLNIASNVVVQVLQINKQIEGKQERIKALDSTQMALSMRGKAEQMDILADCFNTYRMKVAVECGQVVETAKPMVNALNKEAIKKAISTIDAEISGQVRLYNSTAQSLGVSKIKHNNVHLYIPNDSPFMYSRIG
ncbi:hypothetical protein EV207_10635 [Scopulibacillus darangshiensis]|uniref:Uncharacterized protein n=1 Tax=Scopulibacillus darangshiensis TaxID=442528 RepID=A0A4R2P5W9_9BACL|nr:hypothetical protein [Scopulibacillus darangshiensis]TCP30212.1 hypothetical protein EV207_10635 [Scopulibacillus darangshiensis]